MRRAPTRTRLLLSVLTLTVALVFAGCDSSGSETEPPPEPFFDATLSGAIDASLEGTAALGADFGAGTFFVLDLPPTAPLSGRTITALQLRDAEEAVTHEISLVYFGDDRLAPGTYDANPDIDSSVFEDCRDAEVPPACIRDALGARFSTNYTRQTADSLYSYQISEGQIVIEASSEDVIEGTFQLEAGSVMVVAREEMELFREALRGWNGDPEDLPPFPDREFRLLNPSLMIDGTFAAAPADLPPLGS